MKHTSAVLTIYGDGSAIYPVQRRSFGFSVAIQGVLIAAVVLLTLHTGAKIIKPVEQAYTPVDLSPYVAHVGKNGPSGGRAYAGV